MAVNIEKAGDPQNPTIIFVHGAGGSAATWFLQLKSLSDNFHIVAVELNGHGRSPDRGERDTTYSYLEDIKEILSDYEKPVLAGHSMGGMLSQLFALQYPDLLSGIILIGTGAKLKVMPTVFEMLETNFEGYVNAAGELMFHEGASKKLIESSKKEIRKCKPEIISRDFAACNSFDIMDSVASIQVPTLILVGKQDLMTPVKYSEYLHTKIPNSTLHIIDNAGHSVMLEQPTILNSHIMTWMSSLH
jgi:pimeloyl-ACP methyl ester carboxylesterase